MRIAAALPFSLLIASATLLSGCGVDVVSTTSSPTHLVLQGTVFGGSQPIRGSHIYLYAASITGYGGNGIAPSALNASVSLLAANTGTTVDGNGNYYVTSGSDGSFSIAGDFTSCVSGSTTQVYLYAMGGNPGSGSNSAIGLLAALGSCTTLSTSTKIRINEATTIATAYSLAGFTTDPTHVSSSGTPLAQVGIANAFLTMPTLTNPATGSPVTSSSYYGSGTTTQTSSLSNVLAACVNSADTTSGGSVTHSSNCSTLFSNATPPASPTSLPTDTATAAINMAHTLNPTPAQLLALSNLQAATGAPFAGSQTLSALTLSIVYMLNAPGVFAQTTGGLVIDGNGNVWLTLFVPGQGTIELDGVTTTGTLLPGSPFLGDGKSLVNGSIAIDRYNNLWIGNSANGGISEFTNNGSPAPGSPFAPGNSGTLAFDGAGYLWSFTGTQLVKLTASGSPITGATYTPPAGSSGLHIDGAGSFWLTTSGNSAIKISHDGTSTSSFAAPGISGGPLDSAGNFWFSTTSATSSPFLTSQSYGLFSNSGALIGPYLINDAIFTSADSQVFPLNLSIDGSGLGWAPGSTYSTTGQINLVYDSNTPEHDSLAYNPGLALDSSGNAWITGAFGQVEKLIGVAAPVITPICAGLPSTFTADGSSNLSSRP